MRYKYIISFVNPISKKVCNCVQLTNLMELHYGRSNLNIQIPGEYDIICPKEVEGVKDIGGELEACLYHPIGTKPLKKLVEGKGSVVFLVNDITRPCPLKEILPAVLGHLNDSGIADGDITVVFGLGSHRRQTEKEQGELVGSEVFSRVRCIDHDVNRCIDLGKSSYGTPIEIFSEVASADVKICIGSIEYHYFVGYTGGMKGMFPGVASMETITSNHRLMLREGAVVGNLQSPVRKDIEEMGAKVGIDFIINVVLNAEKEVVKVVVGDPILAHREGASKVDSMLRVSVKPHDLVIASTGGYPKDVNLYQSHKALENASMAVRKGGTIVLAAECPDGIGSETLIDWLSQASSPRDLIQRFSREFVLGGHKAYSLGKILEHSNVYLYSGIEGEDARLLFKEGFFKVCDDIEGGLREIIDRHQASSVLVMPYAGSTLPV